MLSKIFAFFGFKAARGWVAQADSVRLTSLLRRLESADVGLEEWDYEFVERFFGDSLKAKYDQELRGLRRKFAIRGCKLGLIECAERSDGMMTAELLDWREEARRNWRKTKTTEDENELPNENEILPGSLADFRADAGVRGTDGG